MNRDQAINAINTCALRRRWQVFYTSEAEQGADKVANIPVMTVKIPGDKRYSIRRSNGCNTEVFHAGYIKKVWPAGWSGWRPEQYSFHMCTGSAVQCGITATQVGSNEKQIVCMMMQKNGLVTDKRKEMWIYHTRVANNIMKSFKNPPTNETCTSSSWHPARSTATPDWQ